MKKLYVCFALLAILLFSADAHVLSAGEVSSSGKLKGIVQCVSGGPAVGATVSLQGGLYLAVTDDTGAFVIHKLPAGTYTVTVHYNGIIQKAIESVQVLENKPTDLGVLSISCVQPCSINDGCSSGSYCAKAAGDCSGRGICSALPSFCIAVYDPVCGCDGKTYSNDCEAARAGVNVLSRGECVVLPPPVACGDNSQCAGLEYCAKAVGDCSGQGTCSVRPSLCTAVYDPVCGCDGKTYSNDCEAAMAGVNVVSKGECVVVPPPPVACTENLQCGVSEYCSKMLGNCSGAGTCSALPELCAAVYDPVCGCDGKTYSNECEAARVGVNVASKGECVVLPPPPVACGDNSQCAATEYCAKAVGDCPGQGTCSVRPSLCTAVYDPVCGCDGKTYSNDCEAAMAGVNVLSKGECVVLPPPPVACGDNSQCAATEYCSKTSGNCAGEGTCAARPSFCVSLYDPVCGCDGKTYSNDCEAAMAGVSVASRGACVVLPPPPAACTSNLQCTSSQYCSKPAGYCTAEGTCSTKPTMCIMLFDPVCGCDGRTYSNSCFAAAAGVSVSYKGSCTTTVQP